MKDLLSLLALNKTIRCKNNRLFKLLKLKKVTVVRKILFATPALPEAQRPNSAVVYNCFNDHVSIQLTLNANIRIQIYYPQYS